LGVYELCDESFRVIYAGYAGSRARFGIRGKLKDHFSDFEPNLEIRSKARYFRYEVTSNYLGRWAELLGRHMQLGTMPVANTAAKDMPRHLPRFGQGASA
jgi:hypothetical protein